MTSCVPFISIYLPLVSLDSVLYFCFIFVFRTVPYSWQSDPMHMVARVHDNPVCIHVLFQSFDAAIILM